MRVAATNDEFSAVTKVYLSKDKLESFRSALDGFPASATDSRYAALGDVGNAEVGNGISLRLYCIGHSGHTYVAIRVEAEANIEGGVPQLAVISARVEASAIDTFLAEIADLICGKQDHALLRLTV